MNGWQIILLSVAISVVVLGLLTLMAPRTMIRLPISLLLHALYRKKLVGLENLPKERGCVVVSNHVSWIDGVILLWMLPRNIRFVVDGDNFSNPIFKFLAGSFGTIMMTASPKAIGRALKTGRQGVTAGDLIGIFPEGTLTRTGQLQAFKAGYQKMLKGTDGCILPMYLDGMWGSIFSHSDGKLFFKWPRKFRRKLTLHIGKPLSADTSLSQVRSKVQALGAVATIDSRCEFPILARRVIRVWRKRGRAMQAADSLGQEVSGRSMLLRVLALRRVLRREVFTSDEQYVGVLLPPSVGGVAVNVALAMDRRIAANLNYTVSNDVINHCIQDVGVKHVLSTEKFIS